MWKRCGLFRSLNQLFLSCNKFWRIYFCHQLPFFNILPQRIHCEVLHTPFYLHSLRIYSFFIQGNFTREGNLTLLTSEPYLLGWYLSQLHGCFRHTKGIRRQGAFSLVL